MNPNLQQLQSVNPLSGLLFAEPVLKRSYETLTQPVANLQTKQVVTADVARITEPAIITDLRSLREEERNTADPITIRAFSHAMALLEFVHLVLNDPPRALLAADSEGGIRIEWLRDNRTVRVVIPAAEEQPAYIYQRLGRESDIKQFSKSSVVQTLRSIILTP